MPWCALPRDLRRAQRFVPLVGAAREGSRCQGPRLSGYAHDSRACGPIFFCGFICIFILLLGGRHCPAVLMYDSCVVIAWEWSRLLHLGSCSPAFTPAIVILASVGQDLPRFSTTMLAGVTARILILVASPALPNPPKWLIDILQSSMIGLIISRNPAGKDQTSQSASFRCSFRGYTQDGCWLDWVNQPETRKLLHLEMNSRRQRVEHGELFGGGKLHQR